MSWKVPGYRAQSVEGVDGDLETWRGIDEATGREVVLRRVDGRAGDVDDANWRSAAIQGIGYAGLLAPNHILRDGDDLVVGYDVPHGRGAPGRGPAYVATLITQVAGQVHALHAAGMTHGSVGPATVRRDHGGEPVLIGAAESALRGGSGDDTALDDVRSLARLGLRLLGSRRDGEGAADRSRRGLSAVLTATAGANATGEDPCDPSLSAELARQCTPYVDDEPTASIPAQAEPNEPGGGEYVARHRRTPSRRRWTRVRRSQPTPRRPVSSSVSGPATGIAVVAVLLAIAAWMGTVWGDGAGPQSSAALAAAQQSPQTKKAAGPIDVDSPDGGFDAPAASAAQWMEYLGGLYANRTTAITNRVAVLLDQVYIPTSPQRDADLSVIGMLADSGARIVGFAPELVAVNEISSAGESVVVRVVDRIPPYTVVDVAGAATTHAGRGEQAVTLSLALVNGKWLIDTAIRAA